MVCSFGLLVCWPVGLLAIRLLNTHLLAAFIYIFMRHTPSLIGNLTACLPRCLFCRKFRVLLATCTTTTATVTTATTTATANRIINIQRGLLFGF